jgi:hypothetical protein
VLNGNYQCVPDSSAGQTIEQPARHAPRGSKSQSEISKCPGGVQ